MAKEIESLKPKAPKERKILGMKLENECGLFFLVSALSFCRTDMCSPW